MLPSLQLSTLKKHFLDKIRFHSICHKAGFLTNFTIHDLNYWSKHFSSLHWSTWIWEPNYKTLVAWQTNDKLTQFHSLWLNVTYYLKGIILTEQRYTFGLCILMCSDVTSRVHPQLGLQQKGDSWHLSNIIHSKRNKQTRETRQMFLIYMKKK